MSKGKYKIDSLDEILLKNEIEISCPIVVEGILTPYYITSFGRVYRYRNGKIYYLVLIEDKNGYLRAAIRYRKNNKINRISIMVDRLVAMAFIPNSNPEEYTEVNHINGREKKNNNINNLEWCSHSYNMKHAYDNNLHRKGEDSPLSIYSEKQIRQVCELLEKNQLSYTGISFETGVAIYTIISILQHKKWTHISKNYNIDNYNMRDVNTGSKPKYKIKDICKIICGGTPSTENKSYWGTNNDIVWLTPKDLSVYKGKYVTDSLTHITKLGLQNSSAKIVPTNTVLLSSRAPIGYLAISKVDLCTNQGFKALIPNEYVLNYEYLYYLLMSKIDELQSISTGSTFLELSTNTLKEYKIDIHSLPEQQHIVNSINCEVKYAC